MEPLVSAIIPAYNRARYVAEALDSVLGQGYARVEAVVVDDGSTDGTPDVVRRYARSDSRVRLLCQANAGPAHARNAGVAAAGGDLLALLDSDDRWCLGKLARQLPLFDDPAVGMVHAAIRCFRDSDGAVLSEYFPGEDAGLHTLLSHHGLGTQTLIFRRHVFDAVGGFDEAFTPAEDWEFTLRVAAKFRIRGVPDALADIRIHEDQLSGNTERIFRASMNVLRRHGRAHPGPDGAPCPECREAVRYAKRKIRGFYYPYLNRRARRAASDGRYASAAWLGLRALWQQPGALLRGLKKMC